MLLTRVWNLEKIPSFSSTHTSGENLFYPMPMPPKRFRAFGAQFPSQNVKLARGGSENFGGSGREGLVGWLWVLYQIVALDQDIRETSQCFGDDAPLERLADLGTSRIQLWDVSASGIYHRDVQEISGDFQDTPLGVGVSTKIYPTSPFSPHRVSLPSHH